jgi:pyrroline-5-carboxylate reductase
MGTYELGIIGGGNMAQAIVRGAIGSGFLKAGAVVASDVSPAAREAMSRLGARAVADNAEAAGCPRVLLAVKPRQAKDALAAAAGSVSPDATVISIVAGVRAARLDEWLGGRGRLIRVMPNTPVLVGEGMSCVAAGPRATKAGLAWTEALFASAGRTIRVDESLMDAVTAVSGSGPAYVFYLAEAMIAAGVAEGLAEPDARMLAAQTCLGAGKLLAQSGESPQTLRAKVTSPGGTTQRAIETMDAAGVPSALVKAIRSAALRSRELGK